MKKDILWLTDLNKKSIALAGGKGANLAEMYNASMPVPNAFVISAQSYKRFLEEAEIKEKIFNILSNLDVNNTEELKLKTEEIRKIIIDSEIPDTIAIRIEKAYEALDKSEELDKFRLEELPFVAVRSSATTEDLSDASFAGQQDTYLNIKGKREVLNAVKRCWASLFTARATYYREKKGFDHEKALIAVIIQKMVNSEKSGVAFTVNPLNNNKQEVVAEAVFGLGEGIVSGAIEPDHYVINKETGRLKEKRIGHKNFAITRNSAGKNIKQELKEGYQDKQVMYDHELKKLWEALIKIENHYKSPQDVEFAFGGGELYITQSRPITTLKKPEEESKKEETFEPSSTPILDGLAASPGVASGTVKIIHNLDELNKVEKGDVLVTKMTNPDMVVSMQKASAIVTDEGGATCHAAIVSRELGIPAVVGTKKATEVLKEDQEITVDGKNGKVYEGKKKVEEEPEKKYEEQDKKENEEELEESNEEVKQDIKEFKKEEKVEIPKDAISDEMREAWNSAKQTDSETEKDEDIETDDILIKVNCDLPQVAEKAAATNADGVGLVRIEFIIAEGGTHPVYYLEKNKLDDYTDILYDGILKIAQAFKGKPVWVRTSDIRTDEYKTLRGAQSEPDEDNPMLGWHGIRRSIEQEKILEAEFKAIKRLHHEGYDNVGVMVPFLTRVDELKKAKEIMNNIGLEPLREVEFGVMIETPASCMIIEELCKEGISFISFGTNDLTQTTLGVDRNNENLASIYNEMHPAVLRLIDMVISVCKKHHVQTSICGQAGSKPEMAKFLIQRGISSISVNIDAVDKIRSLLK